MSDVKTVGQDEMVCSACGAIIKKAATICPKCGVATMSMGAYKHAYEQMVPGGIGKKWAVTLVLALIFGWLGVHRFYVGKIGTGILWLLTFGLGCIGWVVDIILILTGHFKDKKGNYIRLRAQSPDQAIG
jgi:TM2 domain-containing membrane protein YozV/ribosomal protein L40E